MLLDAITVREWLAGTKMTSSIRHNNALVRTQTSLRLRRTASTLALSIKGNIMSFEDKSIEEMEKELLRVKREIDTKGLNHPEYKIMLTMMKSIEKSISDKEQISK